MSPSTLRRGKPRGDDAGATNRGLADGVAESEDGPPTPSVKVMVAVVAGVVAGTILLFFGLGYVLGRIYL